jgi:lysophospholipase L1-like esterase
MEDGLPTAVASKPMRKLKRFGFILILNAAILLPMLYVFEFFLGWKDPRRSLPANGMVNGKLLTWGHVVVNNHLAFREREFATPRTPGVFRIMVVGDSLTWGAGLALEERYTNRLEKSLNETQPGKIFEVLNFGLMGGPTTVERNVLSKYKDIVKPDLIVVGFCINDTQSREQHYSPERAKFEARIGGIMNSSKHLLSQVGLPAIAELTRDAAYGFAEKTNMIPTWSEALDRTYVKTSPEWQDFVKALKDIKQMSDEMKLPQPVFVALNQGQFTGQDYVEPNETISYFLKWTRQAEAAAREVGFRTLNYEKEIATELKQDSLVLNAVDGHPSSKLNELYAKKLLGVVVDDLGLKGETVQPGR